ncbi:hypothetical protein SAGO17_00113, partial [Mimivirus AB-566-O17]
MRSQPAKIVLHNDKWISKYLSGNYSQRDRLMHHIPIETEDLLIKYASYSGPEITLYRGYSFKNKSELREWYNNEIVKEQGNDMILKIDRMTSWTDDYETADSFAYEEKFGIVFSHTFTKHEFGLIWDLSSINPIEREYLVKSGTFKCTIENVLVNGSSVDSIQDWEVELKRKKSPKKKTQKGGGVSATDLQQMKTQLELITTYPEYVVFTEFWVPKLPHFKKDILDQLYVIGPPVTFEARLLATSRIIDMYINDQRGNFKPKVKDLARRMTIQPTKKLIQTLTKTQRGSGSGSGNGSNKP